MKTLLHVPGACDGDEELFGVRFSPAQGPLIHRDMLPFCISCEAIVEHSRNHSRNPGISLERKLEVTQADLHASLFGRKIFHLYICMGGL